MPPIAASPKTVPSILSPSPNAVDAESPYSLLIVDDHPILRSGLKHILSESPRIRICGEAANAASALEQLHRLQPSVVILDVKLPDMSGIDLIGQILRAQPDTVILMLSMHLDSGWALRALRAGAKGYLTKREALDHLEKALSTLLDGGMYLGPAFAHRPVFQILLGSEGGDSVSTLSVREREILQLIGHGCSTAEIAGQLELSRKTVETHDAHIREKLGLRDHQDLIAFARDWVIANE